MKRALKLFVAGVLCAAAAAGGGCSSGGDNGQTPSPSTTLTLSSNKSSILANGSDAAVLTVFFSGTQEDVTSKAELFANDEPLSIREFTTSTPGNYTLKAVYNGVTSNTVNITAVSGESADGIRLEASKTAIYPDGGDFSVLSLKTEKGDDVTAQGEFYANGEKLENNRFSTTKGSLAPVTVTAKFNGIDVSGNVQITASTSYAFTSRMLFEDITKTSCTNCPKVIRLIEELRTDAQPLVVPYSIHNSQCDIYKNYYSQATRQFADKYCDFVGVDHSVAPKVYLNRSREFANMDLYTADALRKEALNGPKEVAIALESTLEGSTISVKATVGSKKNFSGKIVVVLVENGIYASQMSMGNTEMYRTMRAYAPSIEGEPKSFNSGSATTYSTTFDLNVTTVRNPNNCEVIAFVTDDADGLCENVQFAGIGEVKGY